MLEYCGIHALANFGVEKLDILDLSSMIDIEGILTNENSYITIYAFLLCLRLR